MGIKRVSELSIGSETKRGKVTHILPFPPGSPDYGRVTIVTDTDSWTCSLESRIWVS